MEQLNRYSFKQKVYDYESVGSASGTSNLPGIVVFHADWCRPCRMIEPILEELEKEYSGQVRFFKINSEKERELTSSFDIKSIPSILFVPADGEPQMVIGAIPKSSFVRTIEEVFQLKQAFRESA